LVIFRPGAVEVFEIGFLATGRTRPVPDWEVVVVVVDEVVVAAEVVELADGLLPPHPLARTTAAPIASAAMAILGFIMSPLAVLVDV
jgi:hypothetical protein